MAKVDIDINATDNTKGAISSCASGFDSLGATIAAMALTAETQLRRVSGTLALIIITVSELSRVVDMLTSQMDVFINFEQAMVGVAKTTGMVDEELQGLGDTLRVIATEAPVSATELANIAAVAGQLGIQGSENIAMFTETVMQMSVATELTADNAAVALAKLSNAFQIPIADIENLASVINELSNTTAATSTEIIDSMVRVAGTASIFDVPAEAIAALTATLVSAGINAERAGTELASAFIMMQQNAEKAAAAMGMSVEQFRKCLEEDFLGTFLAVMQQIEQGGITAEQVFDIFGTVGAKAVLPLAENLDQFAAAMGVANDQMATGTSLSDEYNRAIQSLASQLQILRNNFEEIMITIVESFADPLREIIGLMNTQLIPALQTFAGYISTLDYTPIVEGTFAIIDSIITLCTTIQDSESTLQTFIDLIGKLGLSFAMCVDAIGVLIGGLSRLLSTISAYVDALSKGLGPLDATVIAFATYQQHADDAAAATFSFAQHFLEFFGIIESGLPSLDAAAGSTSGVGDAANGSSSAVSSFNNVLTEYINTLLQVPTEVVTEVKLVGLDEASAQLEDYIASLTGRSVDIGINVPEEEKIAKINEELEKLTGEPQIITMDMTGAEKIRAIEEALERITGQDIVMSPEVDMEELYQYNDTLRSIENTVLNVVTKITGDDPVWLKNVLDSIVDKKVDVKMETMGIEKIEDADRMIQDLKLFGANIPINADATGLTTTVTDAKTTIEQPITVPVQADTTQATQEVEEPKVMPIQVEVVNLGEITNAINTIKDATVNINFDYEKLSCSDLVPSSCTVHVNTATSGVESMQTGGKIESTGIYLLHKGEQVIPSFQAGGYVPQDTLAFLHKGEYVLPKRRAQIYFAPTITKEVDSDKVIDQLLRRLEMVM